MNGEDTEPPPVVSINFSDLLLLFFLGGGVGVGGKSKGNLQFFAVCLV